MVQKHTRREFLTAIGASAAGLALAPYVLGEESKPVRPNILLITVDDMNWDSLGVTGCKIPGISPNIDALAKRGLRFEHAHLVSAVCQPSRSAAFTGRYPHRNGAMGFEPIRRDVPTLTESLRAGGYYNGIFSKVGHLAPLDKFCWDSVVKPSRLGEGRDPALYYQHTKEFLREAKEAGKPFFLMVNSDDPHRPFPLLNGGGQGAPPTHIYRPEEVPVPGFLPKDVPDVKHELAQYFTAVHRGDETVGQVMRALKEAGQDQNTLVIFLSDNGMSFPFAKTNCYECSTRTPMIAVWPGKVKGGSLNADLVSTVDLMATLLDAAGLPSVPGTDGHSILPLFKGAKQGAREDVFTFFSTTSANNSYPMRCVRNKRFSYIFNAWSDGETEFRNESMGGMAFRSMKAAAETDKKLAERVNFYLRRTPEEFYDLASDPDELKNLIDDPKFKTEVEKMRKKVLKMMESTGDPVLPDFKKRIAY